MLGRTLSHYKILEEISRGGMGVVYRALDLKLDREVALKVLPPELVADSERKRRFIQEAKAAAKLEHPHIGVVHEIDEAEGVTFIAMERIRGVKLRDLIQKERIPLLRSLELATEVAEGMARAHDQGIVHRDLKPANIMVTEDGHAKIIDFGLAKLVRPLTGERSEMETALRETDPGKVMGTVLYMSPEQARGQEVDHRSDIFTLGIVLYEMVSGEPPFKGASGIDTLSSILREPTPRLAAVEPPVPEEAESVLQPIVDNCLAKEPSERYPSMKELVSDLRAARRRLESGARPAVSDESSPPSIAVLAFSDMSPQKDQDYFCEGMAEEIINALTRIEGLRVAARTSAFQFKGKALDVGHIGEVLKVKTILEGSVRTAGNRLRVTAQLVHAKDGYHIWSQRFDRQMEDVFEIQDEIALNIANVLRVKLIEDKEQRKPKRHSENVEAYHLYLKGRYYWHARYEEGMAKAIGFFEQAVEKDPSYALPYTGLADSYCIMGQYGFLPAQVALSKASDHVQRALSLDDRLAEACTSQAMIHYWYDWDWSNAEKEFRRALELSPTYVQAYVWYGLFLTTMGRQEEARARLNRALEMDPLSHYARATSACIFYQNREFEEAVEESLRALEYDPNYILALWFYGVSLSRLSLHEKAIAAAQRIVTLSRRAPFWLGMLGRAYAAANREEEARRVFVELTDRSKKEYVDTICLLVASLEVEDKETVFELLERAYQERCPFLVNAKVNDIFDRLRSDPRWDTLLRRMNFP